MDSTDKRPLVTLAECTVLIAGGTSGVGLATALKFAQAGVRKILIVGRDPARGEKAQAAVASAHPGTDILFVAGDANQATDATHICELAHRRFGSIDVLLNSTVGPAGPTLLHQIPIEDVEQILLAQLMGPLLMSRAALPYMREQGAGCIINVASDAGKLATPGESVIGAAMAGIIMFTRTLAIEAKRNGIRVNVLTPSLIEGTLTNARMMTQPFAVKLFEKARHAAGLGVAVAEDLAELVVFLAGPQAARITGQAISVNGGISAA
jgi:NAD(P)-dependent dehydrogenase (short-subunit alcohol dehydrogenase family)